MTLHAAERSFDSASPIDLPDGEVPFGFDEMFFSRTDPRGVIRSGNSVFRRVSGYDWSRLVGAPHRIVRHPTMPKAAFHLLWDRLRAGRATGVYVRNRSDDGRSYWVFAVVVPVADGFLSVRIKPGTATFGHVRALYADLLGAESRGLPPAEGAALLLDRLARDGFPSYDSFQARALAAEALHRATRGGPPAPRLAEAVRAAEAADGIETELSALGRMFDRGLLIATNLRLVAARLGDGGRALSAIADNYALLSSALASWLDRGTAGAAIGFGGIALSVAENLFLKAGAALLDEMSDRFARDEEPGLGDPEAERARLADVALRHRARAAACNSRAVEATVALGARLAEMRHHVTRLEAIRMLCRIEGATLRGVGGALDEIVTQLDAFQDEMGTRLTRATNLGLEIRHVAAVL